MSEPQQPQQPQYTVKARYLIRGPNRTKYQHYYVAGRGWTKDWVEVSVVLGDEDPVEVYVDRTDPRKPQKRTRPLLDKINQAQLAEILKDDINMAVRPIDESGEAHDMKVDVLGLMKKNEELEAMIVKQRADIDRLTTKLDEAEKLLDQASRPATELAAKVNQRKQQQGKPQG